METELTPKMLAHYAGGKPKEYNEVATHKPYSLNNLRPEENHLQNVMKKAAQLDALYKLKNSLKEIESRMSEEGKRGNLSLPSVFNHILDSVVTERVWYFYKKYQKSIEEAF